MVDLNFVLVMGIIFSTTLIRAAVGFGNALIAMPLLVVLLGVKTASPLVALTGPVIAVSMLILEWEKIDLLAAGKLLLASLVGIPIGLLFLSRAPEGLVQVVLGVILIGFGVYNLWGPPLPELRREFFTWVFGIIAGILGGAYNTNGPPVVIFGVIKRWPPATFRATLQGYFLISGLVIVLSHGLTGFWTREIWRYFLISIPLIVAAVLLGAKVSENFSRDQFNVFVNIFLILAGMVMFTG